MYPNPQLSADLVTFTWEILNGKLNFFVQWIHLFTTENRSKLFHPYNITMLIEIVLLWLKIPFELCWRHYLCQKSALFGIIKYCVSNKIPTYIYSILYILLIYILNIFYLVTLRHCLIILVKNLLMDWMETKTENLSHLVIHIMEKVSCDVIISIYIVMSRIS